MWFFLSLYLFCYLLISLTNFWGYFIFEINICFWDFFIIGSFNFSFAVFSFFCIDILFTYIVLIICFIFFIISTLLLIISTYLFLIYFYDVFYFVCIKSFEVSLECMMWLFFLAHYFIFWKGFK